MASSAAISAISSSVSVAVARIAQRSDAFEPAKRRLCLISQCFDYHGALGPLVSQFEGTLDQFSVRTDGAAGIARASRGGERAQDRRLGVSQSAAGIDRALAALADSHRRRVIELLRE